MNLDFESLRAQWALKAPTPTKDRIELYATMDRNANPHNEPYRNKRPRRSETEIVSDLAFHFADQVLCRQYGREYVEWLEANNYRVIWGLTRKGYVADGEPPTASTILHTL